MSLTHYNVKLNVEVKNKHKEKEKIFVERNYDVTLDTKNPYVMTVRGDWGEAEFTKDKIVLNTPAANSGNPEKVTVTRLAKAVKLQAEWTMEQPDEDAISGFSKNLEEFKAAHPLTAQYIEEAVEALKQVAEANPDKLETLHQQRIRDLESNYGRREISY